MKRIGVVSDSHGDRAHLEKALYRLSAEHPLDAFIHCGDGCREGLLLARDIPQAACVKGNCDGWGEKAEEALTLTVGGAVLFATHGHRYGVKDDLEALSCAALSRGAQVALYGHTHARHAEYRHGILLLNPGACAYTGDCALLTIGDKGEINYQFFGIL